MGRRREHDENTAEALLDAAERAVADVGVHGLSVRDIAGAARTTTHAIYTLFGSKDGLVGALGARAFKILQRDIEVLPVTGAPDDDLIEVALTFRRFALDHPALFSIAFQHADPEIWPRFRDAAVDALAVLDTRFEPLAAAGRLGGRSIGEASMQFRALTEGAAWTELRGSPLEPDPERFWRNAFYALITGFAVPPPRPPRMRRRRVTGAAARAD
jgi:AcrR family transcriptional regulator